MANDPIPTGAVPPRTLPEQSQDGPQWRRLSPLTVWMDALVIALVIGVPALIVAVIMLLTDIFFPWGVLTLLAGILLSATIVGDSALRHRLTRYRVTAERMELESGLLSRTHRSLPRERIRSVDIAAPIWARPFGLRSVTVGTGQNAEAGDELKLVMLSEPAALGLRTELLRRGTSAGAGLDDASADGTTIAAMRPRWFGFGALATVPLSIGYGALAAVLGFAAQFIGEGTMPYLMGAYDQVLRHLVVWAAGALLGLLAFGTAAALLVHTETWWNYRLTRESDGTLRVERGLLNLSSISIEESRLRGVELREHLPLRWLGAAGVAAIASGLGSTDEKKGGGIVPKRYLSPEMPRGEAVRLAGAALGGARFPSLTAHPASAQRRRFVRAAMWTLVLTALLSAPAWLIPAVPRPMAIAVTSCVFIIMAAVCTLYAIGSYRGLGHGTAGRFLYLRKGMAGRSTAAVKRDAVIGWTVRRSPLQRRAGLSTLGATVAADKGVHRVPDIGHAQALALADDAVPGLLAPFLIRR